MSDLVVKATVVPEVQSMQRVELTRARGIVVHQQFQAAETAAALVGLPYEAKNIYKVGMLPDDKNVAQTSTDPNRWQPKSSELSQLPAVLMAKEESSCMERVCLNCLGCGNLRNLKLHFYGGSGADEYLMDRPFQLGAWICCPITSTLFDVADPNGTRGIGRVRENCARAKERTREQRAKMTSHMRGQHPKIALLARADNVASREVMKRKDVVADEKIEFIVEESAQDLVAKHDKEELAQIGAILLAPVAPTEGLDALLEPGAALANVKWIHSYNVGVDHMTGLLTGTLSTTRADISVSNGRGAFSSALAEYAMLACLHFTKRVSHCQQNKRDKRYDRFTMPVLKDKTIGFVGFGHIAKSTARIAKDGFGMRVAAFRRNPDKEDSALADNVYTDKLELARKSDYIVCSLPGTPATIRFCDEAFFDAMQEGAVFISCGRGVVVDEVALAKQLRAERIFAALDVYEQEPLSESSELWDVPDDRLLMTAHNADLTEDFCQLGWETFRKNLHRFRAGEPLETPVDKAHGY